MLNVPLKTPLPFVPLFLPQDGDDAPEGRADSKKYITIKFSAEQVSHHPPGESGQW